MRHSVLTEEQVICVLTAKGSARAVGERFGVHRSTISLIRLGKIHAHIAPHIPRWSTVQRCENCIHWDRGCCDLGFPDPLEEGTSFARECSTFVRAAA